MTQPEAGAPALPTARRPWPGAAAPLLGAAGLASGAWATLQVYENWPDRTVDQVTSVLSLVPGWLLPAVGAALIIWRPSSRSGALAAVLGLIWSSWTALSWTSGTSLAWSLALVVWVRPLSYWLLLSWPSGRLERSDRRWLAAYTVAEVTLWGVVSYLLSGDYVVTGDVNPVAVADMPRLVSICDSLTTLLVVPVGAALLLLSMTRRYRRLPGSARHLAGPVLIATVLVAAWDLALPITNHLHAIFRDSAGNWTVIGGFYVTTDYLRFALLPILLGVSALRIHRLAACSSPVRTIDLAESAQPSGFSASVAKAFTGQPVTVAFGGVDGTWVDPTGQPVELGERDTSVTVIERDGTPIAALEFPADAPQRPALVEVAVAAAGAGVELERLEVLARQRRTQATRARRALVQISDEETRRIQRDLHDGAQQRLVGLMLHTRLAGDRGGADATWVAELRDGVEAARRDLWALVDLDADPTRSRTLDQAIEDLATSVPIPVSIDLLVPDGLAEDVLSAAWFVAAEATANAVKHSDATHLRVTGGPEDGAFGIVIADDGVGGATTSEGTGLDGLRRRVEQVGGTLALESAPGRGTRLAATFPTGSRP